MRRTGRASEAWEESSPFSQERCSPWRADRVAGPRHPPSPDVPEELDGPPVSPVEVVDQDHHRLHHRDLEEELREGVEDGDHVLFAPARLGGCLVEAALLIAAARAAPVDLREEALQGPPVLLLQRLAVLRVPEDFPDDPEERLEGDPLDVVAMHFVDGDAALRGTLAELAEGPSLPDAGLAPVEEDVLAGLGGRRGCRDLGRLGIRRRLRLEADLLQSLTSGGGDLGAVERLLEERP